MVNNLIFLSESELDKPVYRIFSVSRLAELFEEKKLTLVKPKKWDDPFENFILNSTGVLPDGMELAFGFRDNFYGQCWTLTKESDAMWRTYSPDKNGVKIKTTVRKLFSAFYKVGGQLHKANGTEYNLSTFVGRVKYEKTSSLIEMLSDEKRMSGKIYDQIGFGQASTFYFKRLAFKHEKEVRLIYNALRPNQLDTFKFDFDPFSLFEEMVFDPRMDERIYNIYKNHFKAAGYRNRIIQSGLYKLKTFKFKINPA